MQLRRNLIANYLGQGWTSAMGFLFIPAYIRCLGMESYALIGVFSVMQAWLSLLDLGMTPTLNREMARYTAGVVCVQAIRDLLRSLEVICYGMALLIAAVVWAAADYLATDWLRADKLPAPVVSQAISVMAFVIALRFVEGIYRGSLLGLQRQVWYNGANCLLATVRHGGALLVLALVSPTIGAFFAWQCVASVLTLAVLSLKTKRILPASPAPAGFSRAALESIWRFAGGMIGINILATLLTQVDKVLLSRMLNLENYGYYTLAGTVAGIIYLAIVPITQSVYPRMVELCSQQNAPSLSMLYHQGAQLVTVVTAPVMLLIAAYPGTVLYLWSGDLQLCQNTAPIIAPLVLGTFLNGLMWMPYQCQLAHGWTSFAFKVNSVAVGVLIPAILYFVPKFGAVGAAWIWVGLNSGYVLICIHFIHRRILRTEKWRWYLYDVLLPVFGSLIVVMLGYVFRPEHLQNRWHCLLFLLPVAAASFVASALLSTKIRPVLFTLALRWCGKASRSVSPDFSG